MFCIHIFPLFLPGTLPGSCVCIICYLIAMSTYYINLAYMSIHFINFFYKKRDKVFTPCLSPEVREKYEESQLLYYHITIKKTIIFQRGRMKNNCLFRYGFYLVVCSYILAYLCHLCKLIFNNFSFFHTLNGVV